MSAIRIRELLEAGCHFGHKTGRWNPKMARYIFGSRNGIHIIDLQQTARLYRHAYKIMRDVVAQGKDVLFVGTKRQAQDIISEEATRCGQFYMQNRWLGGTLTNFRTIKQSIDRLNKFEEMFEDGSVMSRPKKEVLLMEKELGKLRANLGGIQKMKKLPGLIFIVDIERERIAVSEAAKLGIPVVAISDTNADPDSVDFPIPGNDDAIRSIKILCQIAADACMEGMQLRKEKPQPEAKEQQRNDKGRGDRRGGRKGQQSGGARPPVEHRPSKDDA